ncbi:MAG: PilN domain-containing protein [Planctomycetes bacterium]|nr:PilN domain-containing protein [Planctomycetota bacterium]
MDTMDSKKTPRKEKTKTASKHIWRLALPILIPLIALSYFGLDFWASSYRRQITNTETSIENIEQAKPGLKKVAQERDTMKERVDALKKIDDQRTPWLNIFQEFTNLIIPDRLWLSKFNCYQRPKTGAYIIELTGYALSQSDVTNFFVKLSNSPYFKEIEHSSYRKFTLPAGPQPDVFKFEITALLDKDHLKSLSDTE